MRRFRVLSDAEELKRYPKPFHSGWTEYAIKKQAYMHKLDDERRKSWKGKCKIIIDLESVRAAEILLEAIEKKLSVKGYIQKEYQ